MTAEVPERLELPPNVRGFLGRTPPRHATIATVNRDGSPHQIVIWYRVVVDDSGARLLVNSRVGRRWPSNLTRDGRANLAVYEGEDAVTIECVVEESYDGNGARDDIADLARLYYEREAAERDISNFRTQKRITFILRPTRVHVHGDPH